MFPLPEHRLNNLQQQWTSPAIEFRFVMSQENPDRPALIEVDVTNVNSVQELHERLATALGFPDFYGKNWDAFWDAITGLVAMPHRLIISGWLDLMARWPKDAQIMANCLMDYNEQFPSSRCDVELITRAARPAT